MRIRLSVVILSSVLFTIALLVFVPRHLTYASTWPRYVEENPGLYLRNYYSSMGFSSLAIDLVGLIVVWSSYVKKSRWAWFVMFVIVWIYAFPVFMLPILLKAPFSVSDWFWAAIKDSGRNRDYAKGAVVFLLMLVALFLPVKSFFARSTRSARET